MDQAVPLEHGRQTEEIVGISMVEGVGGVGAIVLSILGLIGVLPEALASVAVVAIGISLLAGGGTIASQHSKFLMRSDPQYADFVRSGIGMEVICGLAGIALGVLALVGIERVTLLAVSAVVFGCALLMASMASSRINAFRVYGEAFGTEHAAEWARDAVYAARGSEVLIGVAAIVLGILALADFSPLTVTLVALLAVGTSVMLSGLSIAGAMFGELPRRLRRS